MIELWLGIIALTLCALGFIVWPLIRANAQLEDGVIVGRREKNIDIFQDRLKELNQEFESGVLSENNFSALKLELEKNLLDDAQEASDSFVGKQASRTQLLIVVLICLLVPLVSLGFYAKYGSFEDLQWVADNKKNHSFDATKRPTAEQAIAMLIKELEKEPNNPQGWYMLASAYIGTNQFKQGSEAFARVITLLPENSPQIAGVIGQYAQSLFFIDGTVTARVKTQVDQALALDANEVVSLGLLGIAAFETEAYQEAITYWEKALQFAQPNAAQSLQAGIEKAKQRIGADSQVKKADVATARVIVELDIAPELKDKITERASLFVFARPVGGRIPLAAAKLSVKGWPKRIILDDSLAMTPNAKISLQKNVEVSARISLDGTPQSQKGDLQASVITTEVSTQSGSVKLLIDRVVD